MSQIYITKNDHERLMHLLDRRRPHDEFDKALLAELEKGKIVESTEIPADVITMNSEVRFVDEKGEKRDYWLVFPDEADFKANKISILSPIGCALLGYRTGDEVTLQMPQGEKKLKVVEIVHQPEAEGNYDL
jgi:regulator of nucleoside diphosphate kinase